MLSNALTVLFFLPLKFGIVICVFLVKDADGPMTKRQSQTSPCDKILALQYHLAPKMPMDLPKKANFDDRRKLCSVICAFLVKDTNGAVDRSRLGQLPLFE